MKRTLAIFALTVATAAGGPTFAQSANQTKLDTIQRYAPNADLSNLTDVQIDSLMNVISSKDMESAKRSGVQALLMMDSAPAKGSMAAPATNQAGIDKIRQYAPNADLSGITDTQVASLLNIINGDESEGQKREEVQAMLTANSAPAEGSMAAPATNQAGVDKIRQYAPNADLTGITDTQVASLLNIINGDDSEGDKREKVQAMLAK